MHLRMLRIFFWQELLSNLSRSSSSRRFWVWVLAAGVYACLAQPQMESDKWGRGTQQLLLFLACISSFFKLPMGHMRELVAGLEASWVSLCRCFFLYGLGLGCCALLGSRWPLACLCARVLCCHELCVAFVVCCEMRSWRVVVFMPLNGWVASG